MGNKKLKPTTVQMPCSWHRVKDADIIEYLDKQGNRTDAIRRALRKQMAKEE